MKCVYIIQITIIGILILVVGVLSYNDEDHSEDSSLNIQNLHKSVAVVEQNHHGRVKRSPYDPVLASLVLAKSFILGGLLGTTLGNHRGFGGHGHGGGWRVSRSHIVHRPISYGWQPGPPPNYGYGHGWY